MSESGKKSLPNLKSKALCIVIPLMILAAFPVGAQMRTRGLLGLSPAVLRIFSATAVKALIVALFPTPAPVIINYHYKFENCDNVYQILPP